MAKFNRFDPKNKKKGRNQNNAQIKPKIKAVNNDKVMKSLVKTLVKQTVI